MPPAHQPVHAAHHGTGPILPMAPAFSFCRSQDPSGLPMWHGVNQTPHAGCATQIPARKPDLPEAKFCSQVLPPPHVALKLWHTCQAQLLARCQPLHLDGRGSLPADGAVACCMAGLPLARGRRGVPELRLGLLVSQGPGVWAGILSGFYHDGSMSFMISKVSGQVMPLRSALVENCQRAEIYNVASKTMGFKMSVAVAHGCSAEELMEWRVFRRCICWQGHCLLRDCLHKLYEQSTYEFDLKAGCWQRRWAVLSQAASGMKQ